MADPTSVKMQGLAIALCPKFTALLSMFGSSCLIYLTARDLIKHHKLSPQEQIRNVSSRGRGRETTSGGGQKQQLQKPTYARLVLGMSIGDFMASTAWFLTTWPIPSDTPDSYGVYWNVGNRYTCATQGFFTQFSFVAVAYNLNLSIYYVLVVVYSWKHEQLVKIEPYLHAVAILFSLGSAIVMAVLGMYNQAGWDCWIAPKPLGCQESWDYNPAAGDTAPNCERGDNASLFRFIFYYGPLWIVIVAIIVLMVILVRYVHSIERKVKFNTNSPDRYASDMTSEEFAATGRNGSIVSNFKEKVRTNVMQVRRSSVFESMVGTLGGSNERSDTSNSAANTRRRNLRKLKHSTEICRQALFYVAAFIFTWIFATVFQITFMVLDEVIFELLFLTAFIIPIQGALNLFVYLRPTYIKYRAEQKRIGSSHEIDDSSSVSLREQPSSQQSNKWCHLCQELFVVPVVAWFDVLGLELGLIEKDADSNNARGRNHTRSTTCNNNNNRRNNNSSSTYKIKSSKTMNAAEVGMLPVSMNDHTTSLEMIENNSGDELSDGDNESESEYYKERKEKIPDDSTFVATDGDYQVKLKDIKADDDEERKDSSNNNSNRDTTVVIDDQNGDM